MFYGRVIGKAVSTKKADKLKGLRLLVVQKTDHFGEPNGDAFIAVDYVSAGMGDLVFLAKSKDSAFPLEDRLTPVDAGIVGIVDYIQIKK